MIRRWLDSIERAPVITIALLFEPRDLWVGVFLDTRKRAIYILPLPCLGVRVSWRWEKV